MSPTGRHMTLREHYLGCVLQGFALFELTGEEIEQVAGTAVHLVDAVIRLSAASAPLVEAAPVTGPDPRG